MTSDERNKTRVFRSGASHQPFRVCRLCRESTLDDDPPRSHPGRGHWHRRLHRVAGLTGRRPAVVTSRPCRAPHQPIADVGRIGGGQVPTPGEVSLAHHGVLFLDELPECRRHGLEVLRQPLEKGITRLQSPACPRRLCIDRVSGAGEAFASRNYPARGSAEDSLASKR
jgi:Magnesium chelatase, subunit ChlI